MFLSLVKERRAMARSMATQKSPRKPGTGSVLISGGKDRKKTQGHS